MITITPSIVVAVVDSDTAPATDLPIPASGKGVICPSGMTTSIATLVPASALVALPFPIGVTTAKVLHIQSLLVVDLLVNVGGTPFPLPVPAGQSLTLFDILNTNVSVSSPLGGKILFSVGG